MIVVECITEFDMARNLDLTALRAFVTVAEMGGVTRAAGQLHLTQSAVSMQLKRLEEALDAPLFVRAGRSMHLTTHGEQLLSYGRRMLELNDEIWGRLTVPEFEGEVRLGVPSDIVYPHIPAVLQTFASDYPRVKVQLQSSYTSVLKEQFRRGELDIILTTEGALEPGGRTIHQAPLVWVGAPGGCAWRQRPLRLAFEYACIFREMVQAALDRSGIAWEMGVESESTRTVEASISADLAVHACLEGSMAPHAEVIRHGGALPVLPSLMVNMYVSTGPASGIAEALGQMIEDRYSLAQAA